MKPKTDPRIDVRIAQSPEFARPILTHLRELVHAACPGVEETIKWNHAAFLWHGQILGMMASFKAHCTFGFWHKEMVKVVGSDGGNADSAMGLFGRIATLADLPNDKKMTAYLKAAVKLAESGTSARPARKPRPALPVPADLAAALRKNRKAAATFEKFAPSHRREYIEWITEAKRDETRQTRLASTMEWLTAGKPRHWQYANC